jgi:hypothetical protein
LSDYVTTHLIKFFGEERYAEEFVRGRLFLNRLSYFRRLEKTFDDGRPDSNEAVAVWLQPRGVTIELNMPTIGSVSLTQADLAGPVSISFNYHNDLHILCLYAFGTPGTLTADGKIDIGTMSEAELRNNLMIDSRCLNFGPYAVVVAASSFISQLRGALDHYDSVQGRLVEYYDEETFSGKMALSDIPFKKQKVFSYQKEYRLCVQSNTKGDDPLIIDIGDISHISARVASAQLNNLFQTGLQHSAEKL